MKTRQTRTRITRKPVLNSLALAVLATLISTGAHAAETTINYTTDATAVTGNQVIGNTGWITNNAPVGATVENTITGTTVTGASGTQTSIATENTTAASATGNIVDRTIDLSLIENGIDGANSGAATLGTALNTGAITSKATNNTLNNDALDGFTSGSVTNTDSTISATTVGNQGASSIAGQVPIGYTSDIAGSAVNNFTDTNNNDEISDIANGTIVLTTAQDSKNNISSAGTSDNQIELNLNSSADSNTVSGTAALQNNAISASFKGNSATSTADIQSGLSPSFTGSAVINNSQDQNTVTGSATNAASTISAAVAGSTGNANAVNTLSGTLSLQNNNINSAAAGNESLGNSILLDDSMSFVGSTTAGTTDISSDSAVMSSTNAGLLISNRQNGITNTIESTTTDGSISADADALSSGTIDLTSNSIKANASGNAASSAIDSGSNTAASFAGSAALANQQNNTASSINAENTTAKITATVGGAANQGAVSLTNNNTAATARGNQSTQSLALEANTLELGSATATLTGSNGQVVATGAATVSNLQNNSGTPVSASNTDSQVKLSAGDVTGATLSIGGYAQDANGNFVERNTQEAVAVGSSAVNELTLKAGTTAGTGAGIASIQTGDADSTVSAAIVGASTLLTADGVSDSSTLAVTNNLQRAIGYGTSATNVLSVKANAVAAPAGTSGIPSAVVYTPGTAPAFDATSPQVEAAYAVLNNQSVQHDVTASATKSGSASSEIAVTGTLNASTVRNDDNALVAAAYGNNGATLLELDINGITDTGANLGAIANITNTQAVGSATDITATATSEAVALTTINGAVADESAISVSGNSIQSLATGSYANSQLNVTANNIATTVDTTNNGSIINNSGTDLKTNASFSIQNAQSGQGTVTATQRDLITDLPSDVRVDITGAVTGSNVAANSNKSTASATSNDAVNGLSMVVGSGLASTSAVQNFQTTSADVKALIGQAGVVGDPGTGPQPFGFDATGSGLAGTVLGDNVTLTGGTLSVATSSLTAGQIAHLENGGWLNTGNVITGPATWLGTIALADYGTINGGGTAALSAIIPEVFATETIPNKGGVTLAVSGNITGSTLSVDGNTTAGSATGNRASNSLAATGTNAATTLADSMATTDISNTSVISQADHAVTNIQSTVGNAITSDVYGTFAIDAQHNANISDGTALSVSNNRQTASALGNTASNALAVTGTNLTSTSVLQSGQSSSAAINATSNLEVFAPGAVTGSSVTLSGNRNTAVAALNEVSNTLSVSGTNVGNDIQVPGTDITDVTLQSASTSAEQVLVNKQRALSGEVTSTAQTSLYNQDRFSGLNATLTKSTLTISDNHTTAQASANSALNTASVAGTASQTASVILSNDQSSNAVVTADASTSGKLGLSSGTVEASSFALNKTSILIDGNTTTALARGNAATNVLNSTAGSAYGTTGSGATVDTLTLSGTAGILNRQANTAAVSATSTGASYQVALNSVSGDIVTGNTVAVSNNVVQAVAYGNSATNSLTLSALNGGTPAAAVGNSQVNSGAVTATANGVNYGITGNGSIGNSVLRTSGNQIMASAVGNSSVSSILAAR